MQKLLYYLEQPIPVDYMECAGHVDSSYKDGYALHFDLSSHPPVGPNCINGATGFLTSKLYKNLDKLCKEFDKVLSSISMLAGDFNSEVGRTTESCIGQWSRGRKNQNSINLLKFCEKNGKIIAKSSFQHPAKHITDWLQKRTNLVTKQTISIYNQTDYIILNQKNKQVLNNACSYNGTETLLDHRLVAARIEMIHARIYHYRERYWEQIKQKTGSSEYVEAQQENKWEKLKDIIRCVAETHVRHKKVNDHQISDPDIERMSKEQKGIILQIENCKDPVWNKQLDKRDTQRD